jgi:DNA processing protein
MRDDLKYFLGFSRISGVGAVRFKKICSGFSSMEEAWGAGEAQFREIGLDRSVIDNIVEERKRIDLEEELQKLAKEDIYGITIKDENYPRLLSEIYDPPPILYYKGTLEDERDEYAIGVVGTRKFSPYGKQVVEDIVSELARAGISIVSGLALGIDTLAHSAALNSDGRTISVIGGGLDKQNIYPSSNRYLMDKIVNSGGLMISEYPPGTMPLKGHFPQRNRIIAGLSVATLVIEAPERSGALITSRAAIESNRDVLAVPGNIYSTNTAGTNNLIKMGAICVTSADDVLEVLNLREVSDSVGKKEIVAEGETEEKILSVISSEPVHINELIKQTELDTSTVSSTLVLMEMRNKIKNLGNQMYVENR